MILTERTALFGVPYTVWTSFQWLTTHPYCDNPYGTSYTGVYTGNIKKLHVLLDGKLYGWVYATGSTGWLNSVDQADNSTYCTTLPCTTVPSSPTAAQLAHMIQIETDSACCYGWVLRSASCRLSWEH